MLSWKNHVVNVVLPSGVPLEPAADTTLATALVKLSTRATLVLIHRATLVPLLPRSDLGKPTMV